ncbi:MAG: PadR family transcriptional regulator [Longimicrobiales bacterium]
MTYPTAIVLQAIAQGVRHGFEIIDGSGLRAGTVYPILRRLEAAKLVTSSWEAVVRARAEGRPARRNYRITAAGRRVLDAALERFPGVARVWEGDGDGVVAE